MAKSVREIIKVEITSKAKYYRSLTSQDINDMTDFAVKAIDDGKAKDYHDAIYLAFDNEFQGGSV